MRADTPTPGQCCYEAYCTGLAWRLPWEEVAARQQQRWEAAAQAVRAMQEEDADAP